MLARRAALVTVAALGLAVGVGAALLLRGDDNAASRRQAQPSVRQFRFPTGGSGVIATPAVEASIPEPAGARDALDAFLTAEATGRPDRAYALVARADQYGSVDTWVEAQADRPLPLTFRLGAEQPGPAGATDVTVEVTRHPSLDPFIGFVPGRSTEVWRVDQEGGRWRVEPDPVRSTPFLPSDDAAPAAAGSWVSRLAHCDRAGAHQLETGASLYGPADLVGLPCREGGEWQAGPTLGLDRDPDPQSLVEAFGPDVSSWARLVPVHGPRSRFLATVAPIGDSWRVVAVVADGDGG